jgi:hypothetical protein
MGTYNNVPTVDNDATLFQEGTISIDKNYVVEGGEWTPKLRHYNKDNVGTVTGIKIDGDILTSDNEGIVELTNGGGVKAGEITQNNLVLTFANGNTLPIDIAPLFSDTRVQSGTYNVTTKTIELTLTTGVKIGINVNNLLKITTDSTLKGDGYGTSLGVNLSLDANNVLKLGTDGGLHVAVPVINDFWTSDVTVLSKPTPPNGVDDLTKKIKRKGMISVTGNDPTAGITTNSLALGSILCQTGTTVSGTIPNNTYHVIFDTMPTSLLLPDPDVVQNQLLVISNRMTTAIPITVVTGKKNNIICQFAPLVNPPLRLTTIDANTSYMMQSVQSSLLGGFNWMLVQPAVKRV